MIPFSIHLWVLLDILHNSTQLIYSIYHLFSVWTFIWDVVYLTLIASLNSLCRPSCLCFANDGIKCVCHYTLLCFLNLEGIYLKVCLGSCATDSLWFANWPEYFFSVQWSWSYSCKTDEALYLCVSMSVSASFSCFVFSLFLSHLLQTNVWEMIL